MTMTCTLTDSSGRSCTVPVKDVAVITGQVVGGFIGLNFHYLPYGARYKFLSELQRYASNGKFDKSTKLQVSYDDIKGVGFTKAAIKKYLYNGDYLIKVYDH